MFKKYLFLSPLALVIISSTVTLLGIIGVDRLLNLALNRIGYFQAMTAGRFAYASNEYSLVLDVSKDGLRGTRQLAPKPDGTIRLLALGDSFVFGAGVEDRDTWAVLLEGYLLSRGKNLELVNAGVPGVDPQRMGYICRAYADRYDVDGFIIGIYWDDFYQAAAFKQKNNLSVGRFLPTLSRLRQPVIGESGSSGLSFSQETRNMSSEWKADVAAALKRHPEMLLTIGPQIRDDFINGRINPYMVYRAFTDPMFLMYWLNQDFRAQTAAALIDELARIKRDCVKEKPALLVFFPPGTWVNKKYHRFQQELGYQLNQEILSVQVDNELNQIQNRLGWEIVNLLSEFRKDGCGDCYFPYDGHLTAEGNRRVADLLVSPSNEILKRLSPP